MITAIKARTGTVVRINGELLIVVRHEMKRGGRGATNVAMRLKNLIQGNSSDRVLDSDKNSKMSSSIAQRPNISMRQGIRMHL